MSRPSLVIFDCDGVLVDSEPIGNRVLAQALAAAGLAMSIDDVEKTFRGLAMASVVRWVERERGIRLSDHFLPNYQDCLFAALRHGIAAMPGVAEALARLPLPCCVASSGEPEKMRLTLGLTGLLAVFGDRLFSATQVAHGKPAPDLFLLAANRMQTAPERCIVIEDSLAGIQAARAAGMAVYGYAQAAGPNGAHLERLVFAGAKPLHDMRTLPDRLAC